MTVALTCVCFIQPVFADQWGGVTRSGGTPEAQLRSFLAKKQPCDLAVGIIWEGVSTGTAVLCAWSGRVAAGTVDEQSGCLLGSYDFREGRHYPLVIGGTAFGGIRSACSRDTILKALKVPKKVYSGRDDVSAEQGIWNYFVETSKSSPGVGTITPLFDRFGVAGALKLPIALEGGHEFKRLDTPMVEERLGDPVKQLFAAIKTGDLGAVKTILKKNPKLIESRQEDKATPLLFAVTYPRVEVIQHLIASGADLKVKGHDGMGPLLYAIASQTNSENQTNEIISLLLSKGAKLTERATTGTTPLTAAAYLNRAKVVEFLLKKGVNLNDIDQDGDTALMLAANRGGAESVSVLLKAGARVNHANKSGVTALHYAAKHGHVAVIKILLDEGMEVNRASAAGDTALLSAAANAKPDAARLLLEHGADINHKNSQGQWAFDYVRFPSNTQSAEYQQVSRLQQVLDEFCAKAANCKNPVGGK